MKDYIDTHNLHKWYQCKPLVIALYCGLLQSKVIFVLYKLKYACICQTKIQCVYTINFKTLHVVCVKYSNWMGISLFYLPKSYRK